MNGRSGADYIKKFDTEKFSVKFACEVKDFDPLKFIAKKDARKMGGFIHYAIAASIEAVADSGFPLTEAGKFPDEFSENCGTYISSGIGDFWAIEREHSKLLDDGPDRVSPFFIVSAIRQSGCRSGVHSFWREGTKLCNCYSVCCRSTRNRR
jgi:3-oxoacyl-[acyl-carrier-protein] synthase II